MGRKLIAGTKAVDAAINRHMDGFGLDYEEIATLIDYIDISKIALEVVFTECFKCLAEVEEGQLTTVDKIDPGELMTLIAQAIDKVGRDA